MKDYMNNPMMDMFRNPMAMCSQEGWTKAMEAMQNSEMGKGFNPGNWMAMSSKMAEHAPWLGKIHNQAENGFNFADNMKNVESFADMHKLSMENAQAMLRRQAEIIQKHATDVYSLMQNMVSAANPESAMSLQANYVHEAFDSLVADFKELTEMHSKAHLEAFENASAKVSEHMHKMKKATCGANKCHSHEHEHDGHKHSHEHGHHETKTNKNAKK
jgi:phasin family protein